MASIRFKRGTRAQLEAAATANGLAVGEPYLITDEARFALGVAADAFGLFATMQDLGFSGLHSLGSLGTAVSIDLANGSVQTGTLDANCTVTLPAVAAGTAAHLTLLLTNDGTAGRAVTIVGAAWVTGTAPDFDDAASATNIIVLRGTSTGWIADGGSYA